MKNKIVYIITIILSFFIGATTMIVVYKVLPVNKEVIVIMYTILFFIL